jgi:hypothetical protein
MHFAQNEPHPTICLSIAFSMKILQTRLDNLSTVGIEDSVKNRLYVNACLLENNVLIGKRERQSTK